MATDIRASVHSPDSDLGTSEKNPSPKSDHHLATWESLCLDRSVSPMERSITPMSPRSQSASSTSPRRGGMSSDGASPRLSGRDLERFDSKGSVRRRNSLSLNSDFIKSRSKLNMSVDSSRSFKERVQHVARRILNSSYVSNFMVLVVLFDAYCTCSDIDARAQGGKAPALVLTLSDVCLTLYTIELVLNFAVQGKRMATDWTLLLDMFIVAFGYVDLILSTVLEEDIVMRMGVLRVFRLARIVRLMRLLRKTRALRELQKLVTMMATCLRALAWSFVFCFLIMTVWAMFIVEVVNPLVQDLNTESGVFQDCPQCLRATQSVMEANLLLFKTVIAGDGWGLIAVPVIEKYPATAVIFVGSLLTLVFGVLNLIVAVVVDTFAEARQRDILNLAEELEFDDEKDRKFLQAVFDRIDRRGSGKISLEELVEGARRDQEFQSRLRVMDIDESDLQQLFQMIDTTREGFISAPEFIAPLSRWVHDSKTAPRFIKYNLQRTMQQQEDLQIMFQDYFTALVTRMEDMAERIDQMNDPLILAEPNDPASRSVPLSAGSDRRRSPGVPEEEVPSRPSNFSTASDVSGILLPGLARPQLSLEPQVPAEEGVEQPHASKKICASEEVDEITAAMDNMERYVSSAMDAALRKSMKMMGSALRKNGVPVSRPVHRENIGRHSQDLSFVRRKVSKESSHGLGSSALGSHVLGFRHALSQKAREERRIIGTFRAPEEERDKHARQAERKRTGDLRAATIS